MSDVVQQINGAAAGKPAEAPQADPAVKAEPDLATRRAELKQIAESEKRKHASRMAERAAVSQAQQRAQQAEAALQQAMARVAAIEAELQNPIEFARRRGITARELGERIVKEGSPEEQLQEFVAKAKAAEENVHALRRELQEREMRGQQEAAALQARRSLEDTVSQSKATMPILSRLPAAKMVDEYMRTFHAAASHPDTAEALRAGGYTDADLLEATEARLLSELQERLESDVLPVDLLEKHLTRRRTPASVDTTVASGGQDPKAASSGRQARTLSSALANGSSASWKPDNWDKLSDKKQNEILIARLKANQPID